MSKSTSAKPRWKPGMVYAVPLSDGTFGAAQAIDSMMTNVIYVAVFSDHFTSCPAQVPPLNSTAAIALVATWRQALNRGDWPSLGVIPPLFSKSDFPNERFAENGYIGARHYDAGIISKLLSAFHGIAPWNTMADENYYDGLLMPGIKVSKKIVLSPQDREIYRASRNLGS